MLDVPCSRIAHVYRGSMPFPNDRVGIDFIAINYKRVAEVWMDEWKEHLYKRDLARYNRTDAGKPEIEKNEVFYYEPFRRRLRRSLLSVLH